MGKWGFCVLGGVAVLAGLGVAEGQISNPGPQGPIIQDRMIFYEAALMQLDGRTQALESALKTKDAQLAKLEKELKEAKDKSAALEKRLAALENTLKKVAVGIERGPAPPPAG